MIGYKVKLRYEGFGDDPNEDFWVNLSSEDIHHVGWCANKGKPLIPPRGMIKSLKVCQMLHAAWP